MCGGDFMSKNPEEAMDFLSYVAEVSRGWDEPNSREKGKFPSQQTQNPKAGMYMLSEDVDMKAKVATLARRLEELELKKMHEVQAISDTQVHVMPCTICQSCDHVVDECPTMPAVREMLGDQVNVVGQFRPNNSASYGNTYNSSWRNHPNFSWKPRPPPYQPQAKPSTSTTSSVEQAIANLNNIQYSISRLTNLNTVNEKGKFPLNQAKIPRVFMKLKPKMGVFKFERGQSCDHLRSGRRLINPCLRVSPQLSIKIRDVPPYQLTLEGHMWKSFTRLGASVNLLPYSVYKQLGLGGLKPTTMTLSLADRKKIMSNHPREPFLATSNAIVNCRNGVMQLTFGNMTLELNIFHLCKRHLHPEEEKDLRSLEVLEDGFPEPSDVLAIMSPWRRREEILPLFNREDSQGVAVEDPPKLILKPLPVDLKYAYLEDDEKCPVVVSSTLTNDQRIVFRSPQKMQEKPLDGKFLI
ncbi:hypothetical protein CK203_064071 [Vitis vinifera]|uniref:Uncharacterized protein n=1 Tax=Vitis vinifera TaxID=29760 RepID=A0A438G435_VITVI|nr:hypothetical protein CK203_064071 [Vitis vinifera]